MNNTTTTPNPTLTPTSPTGSDPKVDAVRRLYDAVGRNDLDAILGELAEDVDWAAGAASSSVPWYGAHQGRDDVSRFFAAIGSSIEITDFTPLSYASNDTDVMVPVRWSYTVNETGRRASMTMQHWFRFADDTITLFRGAEDSEQSATAFGASTRSGSAGGPTRRGGASIAAVTPPAHPNVEIIQGLYAALGQGDQASILAALAEDVDWASEAGTTSVPWYGRYRGVGEVPRFFEALGRSAQISEFVPLSITANDDEVLVVIRWTFTANGTGRTVTEHLHHWWRLVDGKVVFYRGLGDSELTASAFG